MVITMFVSNLSFINTSNDTAIYDQETFSVIAHIGSLPGAATVNYSLTLSNNNEHNAALLDVVRLTP